MASCLLCSHEPVVLPFPLTGKGAGQSFSRRRWKAPASWISDASRGVKAGELPRAWGAQWAIPLRRSAMSPMSGCDSRLRRQLQVCKPFPQEQLANLQSDQYTPPKA